MRCRFLAIATATLLVACGDEGASDLTPEQHFQQAQRSMDGEKPKEAYEHLQAVADAEGAPAELQIKALFGAVQCQAAMGAGSGTQRWLGRLEEKSPESLNAEFYLGIATTLLGKEQIDAARKVVAAGQARFPDEPGVFEKISADLEKVGNDVSKLKGLGYVGGGSDDDDGVDLRAYWN